eukprot:467920_1
MESKLFLSVIIILIVYCKATDTRRVEPTEWSEIASVLKAVNASLPKVLLLGGSSGTCGKSMTSFRRGYHRGIVCLNCDFFIYEDHPGCEQLNVSHELGLLADFNDVGSMWWLSVFFRNVFDVITFDWSTAGFTEWWKPQNEDIFHSVYQMLNDNGTFYYTDMCDNDRLGMIVMSKLSKYFRVRFIQGFTFPQSICPKHYDVPFTTNVFECKKNATGLAHAVRNGQ